MAKRRIAEWPQIGMIVASLATVGINLPTVLTASADWASWLMIVCSIIVAAIGFLQIQARAKYAKTNPEYFNEDLPKERSILLKVVAVLMTFFGLMLAGITFAVSSATDHPGTGNLPLLLELTGGLMTVAGFTLYYRLQKRYVQRLAARTNLPRSE